MNIKFTKRTAEDGRPFYKFDFRGRKVVRPGDIHLPNQDSAAVKFCTIDNVDKSEKPLLYLGGDTGDMEGLSRFPKDPSKIIKHNSIKKEREAWERWLERWLNHYEAIIVFPGNHERRAFKDTDPAFAGLGWWWPYGDMFNDSRILVGDIGYRAEWDFGTNPRVFDEHGDELRGISGKCPAASVAEANPGDHTLVFGHTHRAAEVVHTRYYAGRRVLTRAINVGHLSDTRKNGYANDPNWQRGCLYASEDDLDLLSW